MDVFAVQQQYQESDPCYVTKLACNTEIIGALVASVEFYIRLFKKDFMLFSTLTCESGTGITDICFAHGNENCLIGGTREGCVKIWDLRTKDPVRSINIDNEEILSIDFDADDLFIASAIGNRVVVTDLRMDKTIHTLDDHTDTVTAVGFHPVRHSMLASTGEDGLCVLRYMQNVEHIQPFCIQDAARDFTFVGPDRSLLCCMSSTEQVMSFSLEEDQFGTQRAASSCVRDSQLLSDGESCGYVVSVFYEDWVDKVLTLGGSPAGNLLLFEGDVVRASFAAHHNAVVRGAISLEQRIWTCGEDGKVALWSCDEKPLQLQTSVYRKMPAKPQRSAPY